MRLPAVTLIVLLGAACPLGALGDLVDPTITAVEQAEEQHIQVLTPDAEQRVVALEPTAAEQQIAEGTKAPEGRGLRTAGKIVVGVFATVFSLGVMAASLIFI